MFSLCLLLCACMCEEGKAWETNFEHHNKDGKSIKKLQKVASMSCTATSKMQEVPSIGPHHVYTDGAS